MNRIKEIGEIVSVSGNTGLIHVYPFYDGFETRLGEIGSLLKVRSSNAFSIGIVSDVRTHSILGSDNEILEKEKIRFGSQEITIILIGEIIDNAFNRGVSKYPIIGDKVFLMEDSDYKTIYKSDDGSICLGKISGIDLEASIDLNRFITRHSLVVGSTGSGKSNAVAILLSEITKKNYQNGRIIVIDPHGEYNEVLSDCSKVFKCYAQEKECELCIPFWALSLDDLLSIVDAPLSGPNRDYLSYCITQEKIKSAIVNNIPIDQELITADTPIPFNIKKLWFDLDDYERQTFFERGNPNSLTNLVQIGDPDTLKSNIYQPAAAGGGSPFLNNQAHGLLPFLNALRLKLLDSSYNFLFNNSYTPSLDGKCNKELEELLFEWLSTSKNIKIFDLSEIPSEIIPTICGSLLRLIYDALFWGQNLSIGGKETPALMVLEEAHIYLKNAEDTIASKTVQKIAKEGRKYGVGLCLVTQRPSELDETVLSQCGTIVSLRLNNSKDKSRVAGAIQDELSILVDMLPMLRTGEAIISGEAVKIPSRIQISKMQSARKGADPLVSDKWLKVPSQKIEDYKELTYKWRSKSLRRKK